jgi:ankyrin repeat protein
MRQSVRRKMTSVQLPKKKASSVSTSAFFDAVGKGDLEKITKLIESHPELVDACDKTGMTALHFAASAGNVEIARFLTSHNANVNAKNKNGDTPLHMATFAKHIALAAELRENGGVG